MPHARRQAASLADRLHATAIHLLRRVRTVDDASGLTGPALSALSVIVYGGPLTLGALARAEQVTPPTISRQVRWLVRDGLVRLRTDRADRRVRYVSATPHGRRLLERARARRTTVLTSVLAALTSSERRSVEQAVRALDRVL